ncbi:MAG: hypothetical protein D6812_03160 [Deltaproteobacteria bacterium]|nr:MAG: hypothetical protein D6812_03160 [Deltaproteobacteria bacterium]
MRPPDPQPEKSRPASIQITIETAPKALMRISSSGKTGRFPIPFSMRIASHGERSPAASKSGELHPEGDTPFPGNGGRDPIFRAFLVVSRAIRLQEPLSTAT